MHRFFVELTGDRVPEFKVALTVVVVALAVYQLLLIAVVYGKIKVLALEDDDSAATNVGLVYAMDFVGIVGVAAAIFLTWLVSLLAAANAVIIALPFMLLVVVGGGLIVISMLSGLLSLGILKNSQPADLLR